MPELAFVLGSSSPHSSSFADLGHALAGEITRQDAVAFVSEDFPEPRPDRVTVVIDDLLAPSLDLGAIGSRTIAVVTAAPGSPRFMRAAEVAGRAGSSFHVNSVALSSLHALGVPARHLQLGSSSLWPARDIAPDGLAVLNGDGYFNWVEALAAVRRGDIVLHESCVGMAPMVAGRDLFVAVPDSLEIVAEILRKDRTRLAGVRDQAAAFVDGALPLALAAAGLIGAARQAVARPFIERG